MKIRDITYRDEFYAEFILEGDFKEANLLRKYLMGEGACICYRFDTS